MTTWLWSVSSLAATVAVEPAADTMLCEAVAESNGAGTELFVGSTGEAPNVDARRALLAFDLAPLPTGSVVTSAELELTVDRVNAAAASTVTVHAVTRTWEEGTSMAGMGQGQCGVPTGGDATWFSSSHPASAWGTAGGDFAPAVLTSRAIGNVGTWTFASTPALVTDVQRAVDTPASHFGWILRGDEVAALSAKRFNSREGASPPVLTVTFDPGPLGMGAPVPGTAGQVNTVQVTNALPGAPVFLVYGLQAGATAVPGCPGVSVAVANATVADSGVAAANGSVSLGGPVPAGASGLAVGLQVVQPATCAVSAPLLHTF